MYVIRLFCILSFCVLSSVAFGRPLRSGPFLMGVYIYEYEMATAANEQGKNYWDYLERHFKILKSHGVNAVHLGGTTQRRFAKHLALAKQYNIKLFPQLDFAYFNPAWTDAQMNSYARTAGEFIKRHDDPAIIAWSVKEEVAAADVERLSRYYAKILQYAPDARLGIIHNNLKAAQNQPPPSPILLGTDRYAFWWETSAGGYLASPSFALDWTRKQASLYYKEAARRDADFVLVVTQGGMLMPAWANRLANDSSNPTIMAKVRKWAADGRMGWKVFDTKDYGRRYNVWKYYRTPRNCTKALAWIAVLEGAKGFFIWHYNPQTCDTDFKRSALGKKLSEIVCWYTLAGRPGMNNPQLNEFREASQEIVRYERIIAAMTRLESCPLSTQEPRTFCRAFSLPGLDGKVVVVQNGNVGKWPAASRHFFKENDPISIDDDGNLSGYVPRKEPMLVSVKFDKPKNRTSVFDIITGEEIPGIGSLGEESYSLRLLPGSGTLLFLGSKEEARKIHEMITMR